MKSTSIIIVFVASIVAPDIALATGAQAERQPSPPITRDQYHQDHTRGSEGRDHVDRSQANAGREYRAPVMPRQGGR